MIILLVTLIILALLVFLGIIFARISFYYVQPEQHLTTQPPAHFLARALESVLRYARPAPAEDAIDQDGDRSREEAIWYSNFWQGISTEVFGAVITTILLTVLVGIVQQAADRDDLRAELIQNMGSGDNGFALQAVKRLREEGWLADGSLVGKNLTAANLRNADLSGANLAGVDLRFSDLRGANLYQADLTGADFRYALMQEVNTRDLFDVDEARLLLRERLLKSTLSTEGINNMAGIAIFQAWSYSTQADMRGADLRFADLAGSDLSFSDLSEANLLDANLSGANLFMVDLTAAVVVEEIGEILTGDVSRAGSPPIFSAASLMPHGLLWNASMDIGALTKAGSAVYNKVTNCRAVVQSSEAETIRAPRECGYIFAVIPYPPRKPGPFRD